LCGGSSLPHLIERLRLAVTGAKLEALGQFVQGRGGSSVAFEADGEVEMVIGVVGIG